MKGLKGIPLLVGIGVLILTTNVYADTQEQQDVGIKLKSGGLSLEIEDMIAIDETNNDKETEVKRLIVKDLRGTQTGWRLDVSGQKNEESMGIMKITKVDKMRFNTDKLIQKLPRIVQKSDKIIDDGVVTIAEAEQGIGMGTFELVLPKESINLINQKGLKLIGGYTLGVTWDLIQAP